jgi:diguanylate cyclase (GGDEF)-like protein
MLQIELNVFAIAILSAMIISRRGDSSHSPEQRLFSLALAANALTLAFDALVRVLNGAQFAEGRALFFASVNLYYFFNPLSTFACLVYCDYKIFNSVRGLVTRLRFSLIPLAVSYVAFIANSFTGWFYYVDGENAYVRGPAFAIVPVLMLAYPIWIEGLTLRYACKCRTETERDDVKKLSRYLILPLLCLLVQVATRGLQLVWIGSVISFVMIFINIQNRQIYTDDLTGVNNRRQIARAFTRMAESLGASRRLYAVMIDADDFKRKNDSYGHAHGDALLIRTARILEAVCVPSRDFLARMGGDEFLILATRGEGEQLGLVDAIEGAIARHNRLAEAACALSLSSGVAEYGADGIDSLDGLLSAADGAMYRNKARRKRMPDVAAM